MTARRTTFLFTALGLLTAALFIADLAVGSVAVPLGDIWAALTGGSCDPAIQRHHPQNPAAESRHGPVRRRGPRRQRPAKCRPFSATRWPVPTCWASVRAQGSASRCSCWAHPCWASRDTRSSSRWASPARRGSARRSCWRIVMAVSRRIKDIMVILILGMMLGSGISSVVEILQYLSSEAALKSFVIWTMGSLGDVTGSQLALLLPVVTAGLVLAVAVIKPLNLLLLGENYARTMGLNVQRTRTLIFLSTVLLAGTVTAFCGPVGFIGLAVPHLARMLFASADHRILMPASMLAGAALLLVCDLVAKTPRPADQHHHGPDGHSGRHLRRRPQPQSLLT